ncbi:hypothetical protein L1887_07945 [Cichorium endivia]|nr:hypothetical protein L1887_07945 [Cichorium endivia]
MKSQVDVCESVSVCAGPELTGRGGVPALAAPPASRPLGGLVHRSVLQQLSVSLPLILKNSSAIAGHRLRISLFSIEIPPPSHGRSCRGIPLRLYYWNRWSRKAWQHVLPEVTVETVGLSLHEAQIGFFRLASHPNPKGLVEREKT